MYFESPNILNQTLENIKTIYASGRLNPFICGEIWKEKTKIFGQKIVHPIFLYFDDFQINGALGSHIFSVCGIYYSIPFIPQHELSHLNNIFVAGIINSKDIKCFGNTAAFSRLVEVLVDLETNGLEINLPDETVRIHFYLGQILGDNLGLNEVLGFRTGFNSKCYCRICTATMNDCQVTYVELNENLRNKNKLTGNSSGEIFAVKENSIWNSLQYYHITDNKACDIMHDIFLGVARYNIPKVLNYFIYEKNIFLFKFFILTSTCDRVGTNLLLLLCVIVFNVGLVFVAALQA